MTSDSRPGGTPRTDTLRPELAQVLLARVTPASKPSLGTSLARVLGRAAVLPPLSDKGKRLPPAGQPITAPNPLLAVAGDGGPVRRNALMH